MGLESTMHDSGNAQQVCHRQAPTLRSFLTRLRLGMGTGFSHPSSPLQSLARWLLNLVRLHPSARFESRSRCKSGQLVRSGGRCCVVQTANPATPLRSQICQASWISTAASSEVLSFGGGGAKLKTGPTPSSGQGFWIVFSRDLLCRDSLEVVQHESHKP